MLKDPGILCGLPPKICKMCKTNSFGNAENGTLVPANWSLRVFGINYFFPSGCCRRSLVTQLGENNPLAKKGREVERSSSAGPRSSPKVPLGGRTGKSCRILGGRAAQPFLVISPACGPPLELSGLHTPRAPGNKESGTRRKHQR